MEFFNNLEDKSYVIESSFGYADEFRKLVDSLFFQYMETKNFGYIDQLLELDNMIKEVTENFFISSIVKDDVTILSGTLLVNTAEFKRDNEGSVKEFLLRMSDLYNDKELKLYLSI